MENNEVTTGDFETQKRVMRPVNTTGSLTQISESPLMVLNLKVSVVTLLGCLGGMLKHCRHQPMKSFLLIS